MRRVEKLFRIKVNLFMMKMKMVTPHFQSLDLTNLIMVLSMLVNGRRVNAMVEVFNIGLTVLFMKATGETIWLKARVD